MNRHGAILKLPIRNWSSAAQDIALSALAATLAWWCASLAFGDERPIFAAIAAIVCLAPGIGSHGRQAIGMLVGVTVGIVVGEFARFLPWNMTLLVGSVTLAAMFAAVSFGLNAVMVIQAGASAVLVVGSTAATAGTTRVGDSLIGAMIGLLFSQVLFTPDPVFRLRRAGETLIKQVEAALEDRDAESQTTARIRASEAALGDAIDFACSVARWTLRGRLRSADITLVVKQWRRSLDRLPALALIALCTREGAANDALSTELDYARGLSRRRPPAPCNGEIQNEQKRND